MKHRTSELTGALLDAAVAKAEGFPSYRIEPGDASREEACVLGPVRAEDGRFDWSPSIAWEQGGPIIERERISTEWDDSGGDEQHWAGRAPGGPIQYGRTALEAAMRAYVASKLGEEVDLP